MPIAKVFFLMHSFTLSFQSDILDGLPDNSWTSNPILCSVDILFACGAGSGGELSQSFFTLHVVSVFSPYI